MHGNAYPLVAQCWRHWMQDCVFADDLFQSQKSQLVRALSPPYEEKAFSGFETCNTPIPLFTMT